VSAAAAVLAAPPRPRAGAARQLARLLSPRRWQLGLVALLLLLSASLELVPPLLIQRLVDLHLVPGRADGLLSLALLYLAATAASEASGALGIYLTARLAQRVLHELRVRLFDHLQALPTAYYDRTSLGDAISRCTADVEVVETLFSSGVAKVLADLVRLLVVAAAMVALSPPLAAACALTLPPLLAITRLFQVRVRAAERSNRAAIGLLNAELQETLSGAEVVRAFGREAFFADRFRLALRRTLAAFNRATVYSALYSPTMATLAAVATALLLWLGANGVSQGGALAAWKISLGTLTAFVLLFQRFFKPVTALGDEWQTVQAALSGAERIFQVLELPADTPSRSPGLTHQAGQPDRPTPRPHQPAPVAELQAVSFGYLEGRPVLREVSLAVRPGEQVALVGRTGAGKSSVLHLLGGLYAPWSGQVRLAGQDPRALDADQRRRLLGAVPQVVQLFSGTILDNLTLFDETVSREEVERAARLTGADAFIRALPDGYDTPLSGAGRGLGAQLSAGQRQLLALTRALARDPPLLLLDEATAAVDAGADAAFRAALRSDGRDDQGLGRSRAVLIVAHRLSTARQADRVQLVEAGRIVESGPPDDLIRRGGRFAALVELEAAGWDWRNGPEAAPRSAPSGT
jgi:ATP-binding cassette subfamily B protein